MTICYHEIKYNEDTLELQNDMDRLGSLAKNGVMRFTCKMKNNASKKPTNKMQASYTREGTVFENFESNRYRCVKITNDLK